MVDQKLYRSMIGSLLYVTASRPNVMFSVCMCARFQASPRESHLKASWLLRLGLCGMQGWKEEHIGHMSIVGKIACFMVIKDQNSVALSTAEAKYISTGGCCAQILWMKATLNDFGIKFKRVPLLCDNKSAIKLTNNSVQYARTKHINIHHHFTRDHQQKGDISIESVGTKDQLADNIHQATWWEEV